jgi:hypothetical protein
VTRKPARVMVACRIGSVGRDALDQVATLASEAPGRRVTRSEVIRQMLADGTRRAMTARNWQSYRR